MTTKGEREGQTRVKRKKGGKEEEEEEKKKKKKKTNTKTKTKDDEDDDDNDVVGKKKPIDVYALEPDRVFVPNYARGAPYNSAVRETASAVAVVALEAYLAWSPPQKKITERGRKLLGERKSRENPRISDSELHRMACRAGVRFRVSKAALKAALSRGVAAYLLVLATMQAALAVDKKHQMTLEDGRDAWSAVAGPGRGVRAERVRSVLLREVLEALQADIPEEGDADADADADESRRAKVQALTLLTEELLADQQPQPPQQKAMQNRMPTLPLRRLTPGMKQRAEGERILEHTVHCQRRGLIALPSGFETWTRWLWHLVLEAAVQQNVFEHQTYGVATPTADIVADTARQALRTEHHEFPRVKDRAQTLMAELQVGFEQYTVHVLYEAERDVTAMRGTFVLPRNVYEAVVDEAPAPVAPSALSSSSHSS